MNTVTIIGNIVRDAKVVKKGNVTLLFVTVAVNYRSRDNKEITDYIPIKIAASEKLAGYLSKGRKVAITGRLQSYKKDKTTQLIVAASRLEFLSKKGVVSEPNGDTTPAPEEEPF